MNLKKEITFVYMDNSEKQQFQPIAIEAEKRGYKTLLTQDKFAKCEIGFYCQHVNFPQYSKYSFIMLHDIIQGYSNWPNLWKKENWNNYDIGILPGMKWEEMWTQCSKYYYAVPRVATFSVGWPKADHIGKIDLEQQKVELQKKYNIDLNKPTILYAPAWENDGKQDDFVKAMQKLDVNILIKQAFYEEELFPKTVQRIKEMYHIHKDIPGVFILDPRINIIDAIVMSDVLVSEESSTMCEAVMMGKPAVSVYDWLIPDVTPSRFPKDTYDFVTKTSKNDLTDCINKIIKDYDKFQSEAQTYSKNNFCNLGSSAKIIMDIVDDVVENKPFSIEPLKKLPDGTVSFSEKRKINVKNMKIKISQNYAKRNKLIAFIFNVRRKLKGSKNEKNI